MSGLLTFFLIAFAMTWSCWIAVITIPLQGVLGTAVFLTGVFAPSLSAIVVTTWNEGTGATRALLGRMFQWRVAPGWYLFAVSYMAFVKLAAALVHRAVMGSWPEFGHLPLPLIVGAIVVSTPVQSGEEIGWRGYALPRLATRMGFARASIVLGAIWACWHLPQFFIPGNDTSGQSFPVWSVQVVAVSVAMAWVYVGTRGSLLLTMIMHSAINQTSGIVSGAVAGANDVFTLHASRVAYIAGAILWTLAAYFLLRMKTLGRPRDGVSSDRSALATAPADRTEQSRIRSPGYLTDSNRSLADYEE